MIRKCCRGPSIRPLMPIVASLSDMYTFDCRCFSSMYTPQGINHKQLINLKHWNIYFHNIHTQLYTLYIYDIFIIIQYNHIILYIYTIYIQSIYILLINYIYNYINTLYPATCLKFLNWLCIHKEKSFWNLIKSNRN